MITTLNQFRQLNENNKYDLYSSTVNYKNIKVGDKVFTILGQHAGKDKYYGIVDEIGETDLHITFYDKNTNQSVSSSTQMVYDYVTPLNENNDFAAVSKIGSISKEITIELDLRHSMHSMERQGRDGVFIKNADIKTAVDKATEQIVDLLINNTLNTGDPVWIYDSSNDLNVVGSLNAQRNSDKILFKLITCMFHKNFYNKNNTYKVTV